MESITYWTPRLALVGLGGYYGLGIAYERGWMALIDRVAIRILKHYVGYAGIGALMPTVQWYAGWAVRITVGMGIGLIFDLSARFFRKIHNIWSVPVKSGTLYMQITPTNPL